MTEPIFNNRLELTELNEAVGRIKAEVGKVIVGQERNLELMLVCLLCHGHALLEGVPGVAKTLTAKLLSRTVNGSFKRLQFTPDLMPSDILGTSVFNPKTLEFEYKAGPVFCNLILIDEINRAPAKTQAALFELMEERQVTIDGHTYYLPDPFVVIATQNPVEQEGTYRLPEAQLDRFLMKIQVGYPGREEELDLLRRFNANLQADLSGTVEPVISTERLARLRALVHQVLLEDHLLKFIADLIHATRNHQMIELGASPRASLALMNAAKAMAAVSGRDFVIPEDIKTVVMPVLCHRIVLTPEAEMEGITEEEVLNGLFSGIEVPR
ncbi:MAG: MoxR family ATPase [Leadbetterella sp.]|nr:MoxR family ATPase [Leadbetterella sp.]